ncbi:MAG: hypothetical protein HZB25_00860 [Candidatus Eisenbacteria bacterium]|nr:hypothetical protein [Candidatus Eisenbacteria bacterium]
MKSRLLSGLCAAALAFASAPAAWSPPAPDRAAAPAAATAAAKPAGPFAFADFPWMPGNMGASGRPLTVGPFTGELRVDDAYHFDFSRPADGTISGSSEVFRHGEFKLTQLGIGAALLYKNVTARLMTQFGMYSQTTPRNDASPGRGQSRHDRFALTVGGGAINNPGRYLVLMPPINGATALSGSPCFTMNPGDPFKAWDMQVAADYNPRPFVTFRLEYNHRHASVPCFAGPGGVTPPGGNQGAPGSLVPDWRPDLVHDEDRLTFAMLVRT